MANFFRRLWAYLGGAANSELTKRADPMVELDLAREDAKKKYSQVRNAAVQVIAQEYQIKSQLDKKTQEREELLAMVKSAITKGEQALAAGDATKASEMERNSAMLVSQLTHCESTIATLEGSLEEAGRNAEQAKLHVQEAERRLNEMEAERQELKGKLNAAKMQEAVNKSAEAFNGVVADSPVASFDEIRLKIEERSAMAKSQSELNKSSVNSQIAEVKQATMVAAANTRLEQIRESMGYKTSATTENADTLKETATKAREDEVSS